jgi:hypothetical protein
MPDTDMHLLALAEQQIPTDLGVRECWGFVIDGIKLGWLNSNKIQKLINQLRQHEDYGLDELLFEHINDHLRVSFLTDAAECTPAALVKELELLLAS